MGGGSEGGRPHLQGGWYDGLMTVGVPEGKHTVEITPYTDPPVWKENAFTKMLAVR